MSAEPLINSTDLAAAITSGADYALEVSTGSHAPLVLLIADALKGFVAHLAQCPCQGEDRDCPICRDTPLAGTGLHPERVGRLDGLWVLRVPLPVPQGSVAYCPFCAGWCSCEDKYDQELTTGDRIA